jgi:catalase-peroxidase
MADRSESENPAIRAPEPKEHGPLTNRDWWPNQLDLQVLDKHTSRGTPLGDEFDYAAEFATLDVNALKQDIFDVMTTSQD